jgi:hypothetical protein
MDKPLAPIEESGKGRTVGGSGILDDISPGSAGYTSAFRSLGNEAARKVNELFFGPGAGEKGMPVLSGTIHRSAPGPGDIMSVAISAPTYRQCHGSKPKPVICDLSSGKLRMNPYRYAFSQSQAYSLVSSNSYSDNVL